MQGRFFDGRRVEASLFDGKHRYRRSGANDYMDEDEGEEAEKKRLDDFAKWLLTEGDWDIVGLSPPAVFFFWFLSE